MLLEQFEMRYFDKIFNLITTGSCFTIDGLGL